MAEWHQLVPFLQLHITHETVQSMANLTSQLYDNLQQAACLLIWGDRAIPRPPKHSKPHKQDTAKAAWVTSSTDSCLKC